MRRLLAACVVAFVQAAASGTAVVTFDVTVLDREGHPVPDLTAADFVVELNGAARPIRRVTYVPPGTAMAGAVGPVFDAVTPSRTGTYRLVVDTGSSAASGQDFALAVRVTRSGVTVQADPRVAAVTPPRAAAASRATSEPANADASVDDRLRSAVATGRSARALDIAVGSTVRRGANPPEISLDVAIEIPASAAGPLNTLLGVVDASGAIRTARKQVDAAGGGMPYQLDFSVPLAPGVYTLRFAAADATGTVGAVEAKVDAHLTPMGPLEASGLLQWTVDAGGQQRRLARGTIPPDAKALVVALELYSGAGAAPADLLVKIGLIAGSGDRLPAIERIVAPEPRDGVSIAEAEFPLERLAPGAYVVRATVVSGTSVLGTTSTDIKR